MCILAKQKSTIKVYKNLFEKTAGGIVFIIALITYTLSVEPTNSWWDCGEYIATAYKLQVGHPPGAPLFLLVANLFSQFAFGDVTKVALMINWMSVLCSALTILLLFLTTKSIIKKIIKDDEFIITLAPAVGALVYTFSDSFWFSAVEGEVYAMSSFFTALVFWAIIRWSEEVDMNPKANKWLIFIAYLIGLSIGVHLLSLLVIPAIVLIYYFKKYNFSTKGFIIANIVGVALLGFIYEFIIPQFVNIAGKLEIFFVNQLSLPFNSGTIFFFLLTIIILIISLVLSKKHEYYNLNTSILAFTFLLIGYMSFFTLIIRSNANTPIDENSPEDAVSLLSYLNREQYGSTPLLYGQYFNAETENYTDGTPVFVKDIKVNKYVISDDRKNSVPVYEKEKSGLFPRMWSRDQRHIEAYQEWANLKSLKKKPSFIENLKFFFSYQVNHMYFRYFMWNFSGRQSDIQGHGELNKGNWISGINFIDEMRLGPQKNIPKHLKENPGRNTYYFLPFILGLIGLLFHYQKSPKDTWVIMLLFFFTGLAIVLELNQTPFQPRERDYAYAGSFYAFSIWVGIGVLALSNGLKQYIHNTNIVNVVTSITLFIPLLMLCEGWDDHDRSNRYTAREFAKNYLKSCDKDAILFTMGDNDTFPLWYVQEVEGYRTDVRIVNLSLLNTDWYIDQMKRDAYDGKGVPFSLTRDKYKQGTRDVAIFIDKGVDKRLDLDDFNRWIHSDRSETKINFGKDYDYFYTQKISIPVNKDNVIKHNLVHEKDVHLILDSLNLDLNTSQLEKKDIMILDLIQTNNWERPIYFAITIGSSGRSFLYLDKYFQLDGMVYKFVPINNSSASKDNIGRVNTNVLYSMLMEKYEWGNLNKDIYLDETNIRMTMNFRNNFSRLAEQLITEKKYEQAEEVLNYCMELMPGDKVPLNYFIHPIIESYYDIETSNRGELLASKLYEIYKSELNYFFTFPASKIDGVQFEILKNLQFYNDLIQIALENKHPEKDVMQQDFQKFYQSFLTL
tara:strand:+ start:303 stop:3338 length:3036 start_codon:yes stop_codon:yes gene_type:complete